MSSQMGSIWTHINLWDNKRIDNIFLDQKATNFNSTWFSTLLDNFGKKSKKLEKIKKFEEILKIRIKNEECRQNYG